MHTYKHSVSTHISEIIISIFYTETAQINLRQYFFIVLEYNFPFFLYRFCVTESYTCISEEGK